jgi:hypothetical protein
VLSFAGLWDRWKSLETGQLVISCTIIVTDANALTRQIHDRMPVLLDKASFEPWLSGAAGADILMPAADDRVGAPPAIDWDEFVGGYRAGLIEWNRARLGPKPGEPGCRAPAEVLREHGFRP